MFLARNDEVITGSFGSSRQAFGVCARIRLGYRHGYGRLSGNELGQELAFLRLRAEAEKEETGDLALQRP